MVFLLVYEDSNVRMPFFICSASFGGEVTFCHLNKTRSTAMCSLTFSQNLRDRDPSFVLLFVNVYVCSRAFTYSIDITSSSANDSGNDS